MLKTEQTSRSRKRWREIQKWVLFSLFFFFVQALFLAWTFSEELTVRGTEKSGNIFSTSKFSRNKRQEKRSREKGKKTSDKLESSFQESKKDPASPTLSFTVSADTETPPLDRDASPWARFVPGSWSRTRTVGVSYQNSKAMKSVTETKLTLQQVNQDSFSLIREVTIKMGMTDHVKEPEVLHFDFWGVPILAGDSIEELPVVSLSVSRKVIPCQVRKICRTTFQWKEETLLFYSPVVAPYILQKEVKRTALDAREDPLISESKMTVLKTSAHVLLGKELSSYRSQTTIHKGSCTSVTKSLYSENVPGNIIRENTIETDASGNILYQANTILLDYFVQR